MYATRCGSETVHGFLSFVGDFYTMLAAVAKKLKPKPKVKAPKKTVAKKAITVVSPAVEQDIPHVLDCGARLGSYSCKKVSGHWGEHQDGTTRWSHE